MDGRVWLETLRGRRKCVRLSIGPVRSGVRGTIGGFDAHSFFFRYTDGVAMDRSHLLGGKYRIEDLLGEGGMGAVYKATHEQLGKRVAIKALHPELSRNADLTARFIREAQAAAAIGHRSIIDIYDIIQEEDGSLFLVMECLVGESLAELEERQPVLELPLTAYVVCQVLSALQAAHSIGIVHRDLKPDNIFLVKTGQALPDVKLLDFGISKMIDSSRPVERLTQSGVVLGTPYYMSPEQAIGERDVDHRVDIWALGVILYECLTGRVPFEAETTLALLRKITDDNIIPPRHHNPEIPKSMESVILRAMSRDPNSRFATSDEMLRSLLAMLDERTADRVSLPDGFFRSDPASISGTPFQGVPIEIEGRGPTEIDSGAPLVKGLAQSVNTFGTQERIIKQHKKNPWFWGVAAIIAVIALGSLIGLLYSGSPEVSVPAAEGPILVDAFVEDTSQIPASSDADMNEADSQPGSAITEDGDIPSHTKSSIADAEVPAKRRKISQPRIRKGHSPPSKKKATNRLFDTSYPDRGGD